DFIDFWDTRSNANLKSRARTGSPFWNVPTPSWKRHVTPSDEVVHDFAAAGFTSPVTGSIDVSESKIWETTRRAPRPAAFAGSREPRSRIETSSVPPACGFEFSPGLLLHAARSAHTTTRPTAA